MLALSSKVLGKKRTGRFIRLLRLAALIYLALVIVFYFLQDWLLFPGKHTQGQAQAVIRESRQQNYELVRLTTRGNERIVALFGKALDADGHPRTDASSRPTILFFYGNGMSLADTFGEFIHFRKLGCNVIIPEYVGYGMSSGKPSEQALYDTADAAYDHLLSRIDVDSNRIIASGWSLGAAVAIDLAHRRATIGLMTFSAFTSLGEMGRELFPWLPTGWMIRYKFESVEKIAQVNVPIFIAHGEHDRVIPHTMGARLAQAAKQKQSPRVTTVWVKTDHNDIFEAQEAIWGPIEAWLHQLDPAEKSGDKIRDGS